MDEQLRSHTRMIMMHALGQPELDARRWAVAGVQVVTAPASAQLKVGPGDDGRLDADDHGATLGVLEVDSLTGWWVVTMKAGTPPGRIFHRLVTVLESLETRQRHGLDDSPEPASSHHRSALASLNVLSARQVNGVGRGRIRIAFDRRSGEGMTAGDAFAGCVGTYLHHHQDLIVPPTVGGVERHVFVWVDFGAAPVQVELFLADLPRDGRRLPIPAPELPPGITDVWVAARYAGNGCRWDGTTWQSFSTGF